MFSVDLLDGVEQVWTEWGESGKRILENSVSGSTETSGLLFLEHWLANWITDETGVTNGQPGSLSERVKSISISPLSSSREVVLPASLLHSIMSVLGLQLCKLLVESSLIGLGSLRDETDSIFNSHVSSENCNSEHVVDSTCGDWFTAKSPNVSGGAELSDSSVDDLGLS